VTVRVAFEAQRTTLPEQQAIHMQFGKRLLELAHPPVRGREQELVEVEPQRAELGRRLLAAIDGGHLRQLLEMLEAPNAPGRLQPIGPGDLTISRWRGATHQLFVDRNGRLGGRGSAGRPRDQQHPDGRGPPYPPRQAPHPHSFCTRLSH
jgi:hypothetical protein